MRAPGRAGRDGGRDRGVRSGDLHDDVDAPAARRVEDLLGAVLVGERGVGAAAQRGVAPVLEWFGDEHPRGTLAACHLDGQRPDRSGAHHEDVRAGPQMTHPDRVQCDAEWFQQCARVVADVVGQWMQQVVGPDEMLLHGTVQRAVAGESHRGAEVLVTHSAHLTRPARDRRVDRHPAPGVRPGEGDGRELVPRHDGPLDAVLTDATVGEPVQVGPADAHRGDREQRPARAVARRGRVRRPPAGRRRRAGGRRSSTPSAHSPAATW